MQTLKNRIIHNKTVKNGGGKIIPIPRPLNDFYDLFQEELLDHNVTLLKALQNEFTASDKKDGRYKIILNYLKELNQSNEKGIFKSGVYNLYKKINAIHFLLILHHIMNQNDNRIFEMYLPKLQKITENALNNVEMKKTANKIDSDNINRVSDNDGYTFAVLSEILIKNNIDYVKNNNSESKSDLSALDEKNEIIKNFKQSEFFRRNLPQKRIVNKDPNELSEYDVDRYVKEYFEIKNKYYINMLKMYEVKEKGYSADNMFEYLSNEVSDFDISNKDIKTLISELNVSLNVVKNGGNIRLDENGMRNVNRKHQILELVAKIEDSIHAIQRESVNLINNINTEKNSDPSSDELANLFTLIDTYQSEIKQIEENTEQKEDETNKKDPDLEEYNELKAKIGTLSDNINKILDKNDQSSKDIIQIDIQKYTKHILEVKEFAKNRIKKEYDQIELQEKDTPYKKLYDNYVKILVYIMQISKYYNNETYINSSYFIVYTFSIKNLSNIIQLTKFAKILDIDYFKKEEIANNYDSKLHYLYERLLMFYSLNSPILTDTNMNTFKTLFCILYYCSVSYLMEDSKLKKALPKSTWKGITMPMISSKVTSRLVKTSLTDNIMFTLYYILGFGKKDSKNITKTDDTCKKWQTYLLNGKLTDGVLEDNLVKEFKIDLQELLVSMDTVIENNKSIDLKTKVDEIYKSFLKERESKYFGFTFNKITYLEDDRGEITGFNKIVIKQTETTQSSNDDTNENKTDVNTKTNLDNFVSVLGIGIRVTGEVLLVIVRFGLRG